MRQFFIIIATILAIATYFIFQNGLKFTFAKAQGVSADFSWMGKGNGTLTARITQSGYSGSRPAKVEYGIYWCKKSDSSGCAPDFSGDQKATETLMFENVNLTIPTGNSTLNFILPNSANLAQKSCGRFQVDLGFPEGGGIIGGQVFSIGPDCAEPVSVTSCPFNNTQVRVQKDSSDAWGSEKTINLGQSVNLGGFHNGTGRFAGDPANSFSPNRADIDFTVNEPGSTASFTVTAPYPGRFTPGRSGTYQVIGKTRKDAGNPGAGYFSESSCTDTAFIFVQGQTLPVSPTPGATPNAKVQLVPAKIMQPSPQIMIVATSAPPAQIIYVNATPAAPTVISGNIQPECVSLSATPTFGGAQLRVSFTAKGRDSDGIIRRMEINFGDGRTQLIDLNGETNRETIGYTANTYVLSGIYTAALRVRDNSGQGNEWSATPVSCKVKIEVQGQILATSTQPPVSRLPKAGVSEALSLSYLLSTGFGMGLKLLGVKLKRL